MLNIKNKRRALLVNGIGFGRKVLLKFGFGFKLEVVIESRPASYGGGSGQDVYYLVFNIDFYGKKIRKSFALTNLDIAIKFISKIFEIPVMIKARLIDMITINRNVDVKITKEIEKVINIKADQSELKISVKRK